MAEEIDLYEVLGITSTSTKAEVKKAYHRAALTSHPDKVPEDQREEADIKFKAVSQAYEILIDDEKRAMYDQHGMAAFEKGQNGFPGGGPDLDDILAQMFGQGGMGGMGRDSFGMGGMGGGAGPRRRRGKGKSEMQQYEVTLEELYKGKTTKFASTKNVICSHCSGSGGKSEKVKPKTCDTCKGRGSITKLQPVGPGMVTQATVPCTTCSGKGSWYQDKDKCKKCKGERTIKQKKILELYVPRGSREGEHIVLAGEADQDPDDSEPGDIIFELVEEQHKVFNRAGADLHAELDISLSEALTGFNRVVLKHLDGRGIQLHVEQPEGKVLRPDEVLIVHGEGMPLKRSDTRGDLYLSVKINFPEDGWLKDQKAVDAVKAVLPKAEGIKFGPGETPEMVDEVQFEVIDSLEGFGAGSDDPRAAGAEWEDEDDGAGGAQCAQQ
ncbi:DnaJ xdj1 [Fulvia fulva]|uniref:DnaJ xdj1 n=1 Tax=Passalora fulva TaxID=5499 RepID=A0A9Q8LAI1_PASFU|nr:DnaJ xdj1 [Fulvia fulva]KAK4630888.1 DnaJ xdj1 [Fulvia fulva]KAK4633440.1 DnaJ xdj1 [Fulvia fulva]UJO13796.1 DnaJ xdj1 [Fulvia fulva]WPV11885.1 DnaJ xdj1 [Fulvia fulva]WPV26789.1 DnaJ xdj1 [Fulvia fulva]